MAAMSSGRRSCPRKLVKGGTTSTRKHRFESFNQRISKLNIDPIRRSRRQEVDADVLTTAASFFKASLDRWKDLNLSEHFTSFVREVEPLCNSLAQILHYNQRIFDILIGYIGKGDSLSLEPLLDLLSNYAHDLGVRFEGHFLKAVTLVASLAARHADVEAIEWSFGCLAWLFKYLSRLLVPDLRPLFDIIAPLLGREPQKVHTTRFAAEAMSFLIRKAATVYARDPKPLTIVVNAIRDDILQVSDSGDKKINVQLYQHGLMALLVSSIKGIERKLHSGGVYIYRCMLERQCAIDNDQRTGFKEIVYGVTVALIHQTDSLNFLPILDIVLERIRGLEPGSSKSSVAFCARLLFVASTVRKGSRVQDWTPVLDAMLALLEFCDPSEDEAFAETYKASAVILQYSPLELVLAKVRQTMNIIADDRFAPNFLPFCNYFFDLGQDRFQDFVEPHFSRFIASHWKDQELELCLAVPKIGQASSYSKFSCPAPWQEHIVKTFEDAVDNEDLVVRCCSYLHLLDFMTISPETTKRLMGSVSDMVHQSLQSPSNSSLRKTFSLGQGLKAYVQYSPNLESRLSQSWPLICGQATDQGALVPFLEAILLLVEANRLQNYNNDSLINVLIENLHSSSHTLRSLSLRILDALYAQEHSEKADIIATALAIEDSPLNLESARSVSMHARRLASQYDATSPDEWLQKAIPHFCFGMLTFKLSQVWDDATLALKQICETRIGEDVTSALAFKWLQERDLERGTTDVSTLLPVGQGPLTDFQCSNLMQVERLVESETRSIATVVEDSRRQFLAAHTLLPQHITNSPNLALRVLSAIPHVAEKRSRQLVPMFLSWAAEELDQDSESPAEDTEGLASTRENLGPSRLKRKDRKAMLDLFGCFHNPKVLYRSSDVFLALQSLLTNGDVEVQKSALKALLIWKNPGTQLYQENLLNLLDDARFRDEISTFVHVDAQNSAIQEDHLPELMPLMLRLLYGRMIAGSGAKSGSRGQSGRRKTVLEALSQLDEEYLQLFINIALDRLHDVRAVEDARLNEELFARDIISTRKQLGLVNMIKDMLEIIGDRLAPFAESLIQALLYCSVQASRQLRLEKGRTEKEPEGIPQKSLSKDVRQVGMQCLNLLFRCCPPESLRAYLSTIFSELLSPRLDAMPIETAQSISGTLQLFSTWASSKSTVLFLVDYDARAMKSTIECLGVPSAKDKVKIFVIEEILGKTVALARSAITEGPESNSFSGCGNELIVKDVLQPNADNMLVQIGSLLRKSPSKDLLVAAIQLVSALAPLIGGSSEVENLLEICAFLLDQPSHRVNPRSKGDLLQIFQHFIPLVGSALSSDLQDRIFRTVSSLFGYFKDRANRLVLSEVLSVMAEQDDELQDVARLCTGLNSFSGKKIDEPDFSERLKAFNTINEVKFRNFTPREWRPILFNMLFYVKDTEELAIRSNASFALRRFVEMNLVSSGPAETESSNLTRTVLLPALRNGASEPSELIRTEYLSIIAHLIHHNPQWQEVNDMSVLLVNGDEDASFFSNVLHIQQHRRLRALRRLGTEARQGGLRSVNVAHFFIPLIEHYVFDKAEDESAHNLSAETVLTIGTLASSLEWPQFRAMFRRLSGYVKSKPEIQKTIIKLLGVVIDALSLAAEDKKRALTTTSSEPDTANLKPPVSIGSRSMLAVTMPRQDSLADELLNHLLPSLENYLHDKDESTVSLRVPVAISVVKLLKLLPHDGLKSRLPPVLTDVCHILRSRSQESRDLTRRTLVEISTLIGPQYFGFVMKELRSALARGYQLHVLSFTVHSILVATSPIFKTGDLDYCLPQIVSVVMDDIFGATGQEKDAEEYISKMKEVKSSKSYDSLELVAKTTTVENLVHLVRPLQILLGEKLDMRMVTRIDELLRRIGIGLLRNEAVQDHRMLVFCYEVITEVYKTGRTPSGRQSKEDQRTKRFLVNYKGANKTGSRGSTSSYDYKLARFSLDVLRMVLHKYDALQTPSNLAGFIPIIGDGIVQYNEEVQISTLRLLTTIIKVPLKEIDDNAAIYVAECVKIVKASTSTNVELAQAALKLVSAILRERKTIEVRETDLAYLLRRLIPDLEEPDKQGVAFNFLKSIMTRKIVITEVYEVLDAVAVIMVTNQTRGARDMARGAYFQFVMDYPQSKDRFSKQLGFLVRNLDYKHQEGRQSVMEAVHLLFTKLGENLVQEVIGTFFVPLTMVIVNDESSECRGMAGALLKKAFERADGERTQSFLNLLRSWLSQSDQTLLTRVALQMYCSYLDTNAVRGEKEIPTLQDRLTHILKSNLKAPLEADWELLYFALQTFAKICQLFSASAFATSRAPLWASVRQCLSYPHAWVKLSAAKLLGTFFADFTRNNLDKTALSLPLKGSGGLWLSEQEIIETTRASLGLLRVPGVSEELAGQSVRNLVFFGKIMAQTSMHWPQKDQQPEAEPIEGGQSEDENGLEEEPSTSTNKTALGYLIQRASSLLRRGPLTTRSPSLIPLHASLALLGALTHNLPLPTLKPHIPTLLLPLHNLTDPAIPTPFSTDKAFTDGYKTLVGNSQELMALLQKNLGTTAYVTVLQTVREGVKGRREGRRVKRRIEAVAELEKEGERKRRKGVRKKERRKERSGEERGRRRGW